MLLAVMLAGCDPLPPDAIRNPRKIVAGSGGVCALWDDAPMRCWGETPYTAPDETRTTHISRRYARPSSQPDASDVVLDASGCIIDRRGALECTGAYVASRRFIPALRGAPSMRDLRSPVMAGSRVCVLARTDTDPESVWCRDRASVPYDIFSGDKAPRPVDDGWTRFDLGDVTSLALAPHRLCALLRSGQVRCLDFSDNQTHDIAGITNAVQIAAGLDFACARDTRGEVRCFGEGATGQLGDGDSHARADARLVPLPGPATEIAAFGQRACAVVAGAPLCWGLLRTQSERPDVVARKPERVAGVGDLAKLALGHNFTCATRKTDGTVRCWGFDADGALGDGSLLPSPSCSREGYNATSAERERPAGPTVVRTGDAGPHPRWRAPLALFAAFVVLAPLALAIALARASSRALGLAARGQRDAFYGQGVLAALLLPIALGSGLPGILALWNGRQETFRLEASLMGPIALVTLGPGVALAIAVLRFLRLQQAHTAELAVVARRGAAWMFVLATPLVIAAMIATRRVNEYAREELVYLVRDLTVTLDPAFFGQFLILVAWLVLAIAYALFTADWVREERRKHSAQP